MKDETPDRGQLDTLCDLFDGDWYLTRKQLDDAGIDFIDRLVEFGFLSEGLKGFTKGPNLKRAAHDNPFPLGRNK